MLALGSNVEAERETFDANASACGLIEVDGERWFCSRSCAELDHHFLILPDPDETYDEALARARVEGL